MTNIEKLKTIVSDSSGKYLSSRMKEPFFTKNYPEMVHFVKNTTDFYTDEEINFTKRIMLILGDKTNRLTCNCGTEISPMVRGESAGLFRQYCSQKCAGYARLGHKQVRSKEQQKEINDKRESTMLTVYGHAYNSQRKEVKEILSSKKYTTHTDIRYDLLDNQDYLTSLYKKYPSTEIGEMCNCDYSVVLDYLRKYQIDIGSDHSKISKEQREIGEYIESLGFDVVMNSKVLGNQDIDIFIPSMNVGVEFNGFPWHLDHFTNNKRGKQYHLTKTKAAKDKSIRLIHVFPHDLHDKRDIIFSIIQNALQKTSNKIYGRRCDVRQLEKGAAKNFLIKNHLKGNCNFDLAIGLYHGDMLVHVTTFGKSRFDKKYTYEIIRSATLIDTTVIGGFSKCFSYFRDNLCVTGDTIMTYADRSISEGNSYLKSGFVFERETEPSYHYTERDGGNFIVHSRYKFQKHKLKDFENYSDDKNEWEIMVESGYDRFWDCGNNMYVYKV